MGFAITIHDDYGNPHETTGETTIAMETHWFPKANSRQIIQKLWAVDVFSSRQPWLGNHQTKWDFWVGFLNGGFSSKPMELIT
jgi:hypothetical protein